MTITIDLTVLLVLLNLLALGYLSWRHIDDITRRIYAIRACRLHTRMERAMRCKIVRLVGGVRDEAAELWIAAIRATAKSGMELHLLIHTDGGSSHTAVRVKNAIVDHPHDVVAQVPVRAWSAGTSLALACDRIVMGADSVLGPVDRAWKRDQTDTFAVDELQAYEAGISVDMVRARSCAEEATADLLTFRARRRAMQDRIHRGLKHRRASDAAAVDEHLVKMLVRGGWGHHWRAIFRVDARTLGLDVVDAQTKAGEDFSELARLTMLSLPEDQR